MVFKIEKGIPIPTDKGGRKLYPLEDMVVGDSFFVPNKTTESMSGSVQNITRKTGRTFVTRKENGGVRVWRVK